MNVENIFVRHLKDGYTEAYLWQQLFAAAYSSQPTGELSDVGCQFFLALDQDPRTSPREIEIAVEKAIAS